MKKYFLLLLIFLSGCSSMSIESYRDTSPRFVLEDYFVGQTRAWGIFQGRNGQVEKQFTVDIVGRMDDDKLILEEDFLYADGSRDRRVWTITKLDEHTYQGRAADVAGVALGKTFGNALNWSYTMDLPYKDGIVKVQFDDWMFLQADGVMINKAKMTKFGIYLGEVTLVFQK
jgi:hypothetical protein